MLLKISLTLVIPTTNKNFPHVKNFAQVENIAQVTQIKILWRHTCTYILQVVQVLLKISSTLVIPITNKIFPHVKKLRAGREYRAGYADKNIVASYLHIHFAGCSNAAENFINACNSYNN